MLGGMAYPIRMENPQIPPGQQEKIFDAELFAMAEALKLANRHLAAIFILALGNDEVVIDS